MGAALHWHCTALSLSLSLSLSVISTYDVETALLFSGSNTWNVSIDRGITQEERKSL